MVPVVIDMDPGVDDAIALLLALGSPGLEVRGVTTVSGNVPVERGTDNALRVLALAGREDVPVCGGAARPLEGRARHAQHVHGDSGLGEAQLPSSSRGSTGCAQDFLRTVLEASKGELVLVATGPLTNLAHVEAEHPALLLRARRVAIMGGAVRVPGNVTPTAEYNLWADPVAADLVLRSGAPILLVPLDATRQALVSAAELTALTAGAGAIGRFCREAARTPIATGQREYATDGSVLHDPLTLALAICPALARTCTSHLQVETRGRRTAGQLVADERTLTKPADREGCPIEWVCDVDRAGFLGLLADGLEGLARGRNGGRAPVGVELSGGHLHGGCTR